MTSLDDARARAAERNRLDPGMIRAIGRAVSEACGDLEDAEDLIAVRKRVARDSANRADRIRADVEAKRRRDQSRPDGAAR